MIRMGSWFAYATGVIATFGVVCFVARFGPWKGTIPFGVLNGVSSLLQYLLTIPIAWSLFQLTRTRHQALASATTVIGIAGMLAVVTLQALLLVRVLTFEQQGLPVSIAILVVGIWLIGTGYLLRSASTFRHSLAISLLGSSVLCLPYLGFLARQAAA